MNERIECPICHHLMYFIWPSPQGDPEVEAVIGRFQECRVGDHRKWQGDALTGREYSIYRAFDGLIIDGKSYSNIRDWLCAIGLVTVQG